jgi:hypothetical protein
MNRLIATNGIITFSEERATLSPRPQRLRPKVRAHIRRPLSALQ